MRKKIAGQNGTSWMSNNSRRGVAGDFERKDEAFLPTPADGSRFKFIIPYIRAFYSVRGGLPLVTAFLFEATLPVTKNADLD